jgi:hypothetical protein
MSQPIPPAPAADPAAPPAADPTTTTPPAGQPPAPAPAQEPGDTDWKTMSRQWEQRAKANSKAAEELDKLKASMMSDQEKAVAAAKTEGQTEAAKAYGAKLAAAEFKAAIAAAGLKLGDALDLIDTSKFVAEDGEVDEKAIKAAVAKLAKALPQTPAAAGADFQGSGGAGAPANIDQQIADAEKAGNHRLAISLKRQKFASTCPASPEWAPRSTCPTTTASCSRSPRRTRRCCP